MKNIISPSLIKRRIHDCTFLINKETLNWLGFPEEVSEKEVYSLYRDIVSPMEDEVRRAYEEMRNVVKIDSIELHLTLACNMSCSYCYVPRKLRTLPKMSRETADVAINKLLEYRDKHWKDLTLFIVFHGGEPMLNKELLYELVERWHKERIRFGLQTNGTLISEDDVRFFKEYEVDVGISLDGPLPEYNDVQRLYIDGRGTFKDVDRALNTFKSYGVPVGIITTITKHNVDSLRSMLKYLVSLGVRSALFNPVSPSTIGAYKLMPPTEALISSYRQILYDLMHINSSGVKLVVKNIESIVIALTTTNVRVLACDMSPCGASRLLLVITPSGDVFPCSEFIGFPEFKLGNILTDRVESLLMADVATRLRSRRVEEIAECLACPYGLICGANCPASVYFLHRDLGRPSPYCKFKTALIDEVLYLIYREGVEKALNTLVSESVRSRLKDFTKVYEVSG